MVVCVVITEAKPVSNAYGFFLIGSGWLVIMLWGPVKKVISDQYEDNRAHRNHERRVELDLQEMQRRIELNIAQQKAGHDRTMELMQFRKQLLEMEAQENDAMVKAMISTIDNIK
jgi:hypothetical protein